MWADTHSVADIGKPFTVGGSPGRDHFYTATMNSNAGPRAVVMDLNSEEVVLNEDLKEAQARGVSFEGSPGDDVYELGSDVKFPVSVVDLQGTNNHVENSSGDLASGVVRGTSNNMWNRGQGVQARVADGANEGKMGELQSQLLGQLQGAGSALDRMRAVGQRGTSALERAGGTPADIERTFENSRNSQ